MFKTNSKKILSIFTLIAVLAVNFSLITPERLHAQILPEGDRQANTFIDGSDNKFQIQNQAALENILSGAGECSIGQILAQNISGLFSQAVTGLTSEIIPEVPIKDRVVRSETAKIGRKEVAGGSIQIGGYTADLTPSWDAIGFCLVNMIIEYIGQATVDWINNGFEGNPVFVENPERFFESLADREAGEFLGELSDGRLCSPFELEIVNNLALHQLGRNGRGYTDNARCSLSDIVDNVEAFADGDFTSVGWNGFHSITQNPNNNPTRSYQIARNTLDARIENQENKVGIELDWGRGLFSFKDPETNETTSPGAVIEAQINNRLDNPDQRLLVADEFDEIISALVNQLIKVALNEVLE
jgi:hypothetical protein